MFTVIITEKGGAERRDIYDRAEITVGRVQGNDLMLTKGNVSKQHAKLHFRDGRFIVTDLKSTNGTYVNGRKIQQATIVREGDKIYIGDFVLRLEPGAGDGAGGTEIPAAGAEVWSNRQDERPPPLALPPRPTELAPAPDGGGASLAPMPPNAPVPAMALPPPVVPPLPVGPAAAQPGSPVGTMPPPPPPPRVGNRPPTAPFGPPAPPAQTPQASLPRPLPSSLPPPAQPAMAAPVIHGVQPGATPSPLVTAPSAGGIIPPALVRPVPSPQAAAPRETPSGAARRLALVTLVDRVGEKIDLSPLRLAPIVGQPFSGQLEQVIRAQAQAMRAEGELPEGTNPDLLIRDALREFLEFGALGPLLDDDDVIEAHVLRPDTIWVVRSGGTYPADVSFSSEEALSRCLHRYLHTTGGAARQGEHVVVRRLARGGRVVAYFPPISASTTLSIRKRRKAELSLDQLVAEQGVPQGVARFLEACVQGRANLLVAGHGSMPTARLLSALVTAGGAARVTCLLDGEDLSVGGAHAQHLIMPEVDSARAELTRAAIQTAPDRLVIANAGCPAVLDVVLEYSGQGLDGVLAGVPSPSIKHALARMSSQLCVARPGLLPDVARECIGSTFDLLVEVGYVDGSRLRISRISEIATDGKGVLVRDIFALIPETADGALVPTGVVPRVSVDLGMRNVRVDPGIFRRAR